MENFIFCVMNLKYDEKNFSFNLIKIFLDYRFLLRVLFNQTYTDLMLTYFKYFPYK